MPNLPNSWPFGTSPFDNISAGDLLIGFRQNEGRMGTYAISLLQEYMQNNLDFSPTGAQGQFVTQYAAPSSTGFSVTLTDGSDNDENIHLILTPTGTFAAGTIQLPAVASVIDKQEALVNCTQAVTTLTVDGNGATAVTGAPTTLAANDFFRLKYDLPTSTWYRIG